MPRVWKKESCNTCRIRKVKCDEGTPVCQRCQKAGRFCDRSQKTASRINGAGGGRTQAMGADLPSPSNPRQALQRREVARYFHHYFESVATWYDLSDNNHTFGTTVPELGLENPLLFSAIIASSAMQLSRTTLPGARRAAEYYHSHCVSALIALRENDETVSTGIPLAATCLLRAYESLAEEIDPNRHLLGAYSLASNKDLLSSSPKTSLFMSGFWNYLREDITFSLFEQVAMKMDLSNIRLLDTFDCDQDYLNAISLILGRIINLTFGRLASLQDWELHVRLVDEWYTSLPGRFRPYSKIHEEDSNQLPCIWFLNGCHIAAMQHYLLCKMLLVIRATIAGAMPHPDDVGAVLEEYALDLCGMTFTSSSAAVIVNGFGPMCFGGAYIRNETQRDELVRQILGTKREIGWPGHVIVQKLQSRWHASQSPRAHTISAPTPKSNGSADSPQSTRTV